MTKIDDFALIGRDHGVFIYENDTRYIDNTTDMSPQKSVGL